MHAARFSNRIGLVLSLALGSGFAQAQRVAVEAERGMVTSVHHLASDAGIEILKSGGNAVDAAVATGLALAVVYPLAGSLGGGGFMLIHLADGRDVVIDYRETAPAAASRDMFVAADGNVKEGPGSSTVGWSASGVPGTVAGFALAQQKYGSGKITWAEVCEPARRLAAEGHIVSQGTAENLRAGSQFLAQFEESKNIYLNHGAFWKTGDRWKQTELAATLAALQSKGPREFYEGETARKIADAMAKRRPDHARRFEGLSSGRARSVARKVSRLRHRHDAASQLGRHRAAPDARHDRTARSRRDG